MAMIVLSLLPVGLLQTVASLRWLRMPGDTLFAIGAIGFVIFVFGLGLGYSLEHKSRPAAVPADRPVGERIGSP